MDIDIEERRKLMAATLSPEKEQQDDILYCIMDARVRQPGTRHGPDLPRMRSLVNRATRLFLMFFRRR